MLVVEERAMAHGLAVLGSVVLAQSGGVAGHQVHAARAAGVGRAAARRRVRVAHAVPPPADALHPRARLRHAPRHVVHAVDAGALVVRDALVNEGEGALRALRGARAARCHARVCLARNAAPWETRVPMKLTRAFFCVGKCRRARRFVPNEILPALAALARVTALRRRPRIHTDI